MALRLRKAPPHGGTAVVERNAERFSRRRCAYSGEVNPGRGCGQSSGGEELVQPIPGINEGALRDVSN